MVRPLTMAVLLCFVHPLPVQCLLHPHPTHRTDLLCTCPRPQLMIVPTSGGGSVTKSRLTLVTPGSSVHGISQARILECVAIFISRGSSWPRDQTPISCIAGGLLHHRLILYWEPPGKPILTFRSEHFHLEGLSKRQWWAWPSVGLPGNWWANLMSISPVTGHRHLPPPEWRLLPPPAGCPGHAVGVAPGPCFCHWQPAVSSVLNLGKYRPAEYRPAQASAAWLGLGSGCQ